MAGGSGSGDDRWIAVAREDVALGGVELSGRETCSRAPAGDHHRRRPLARRVNMQWLNRQLNQPGSRTMSLLIEPQSLLEEPNDWLELLADLIARRGRETATAAAALVERLRRQGRLAILFDALDQASAGTVKRLGVPATPVERLPPGDQRPAARLQRYWDLLFAIDPNGGSCKWTSSPRQSSAGSWARRPVRTDST